MKTAQEYYTEDVVSGFGTWPRYRPHIQWGTNAPAWQWGTDKSKWRWFDQWYRLNRHVTYNRDIWTFVDHWDGFPVMPFSWGITQELWTYKLARGWSLGFDLMSFTRPALQAVSAERLAKLFEHPWVSKDDSGRDRPQFEQERYAAKLAITLGLQAHDRSMVAWAQEWIGRSLERLAPIACDRVAAHVDNEMRGWERVSAFATRQQYAGNAAFSRSLGWEPRDNAMFELLDAQIDESPVRRNKRAQAHGYYGWNGTRVTQWLLGYVGQPGAWEANEIGATWRIPIGYVSELLRNLKDIAARRPELMCLHTHALASRSRTVYGTDQSYEQMKSADNARKLLGNNTRPDHEGVCVLDPLADAAVTAFAKVVTGAA